jgi:hypothetical protein
MIKYGLKLYEVKMERRGERGRRKMKKWSFSYFIFNKINKYEIYFKYN